jgi:hypothetical protein
MDLVAAGGALSLAIIDACPVTPRLTLPLHYNETMLELQQAFLPGACGSAGVLVEEAGVTLASLPARAAATDTLHLVTKPHLVTHITHHT